MGVEDIGPLRFSQYKMREVLNSLPLLALNFERSFKAKLVLSTEIRPKMRDIEKSVMT